MSRSAPPGDGAWCDRLLALPMPTVLYHATNAKKYHRMLATGHILPPVRGFTTIEGAVTWSGEIGGQRPVILRLTLTGPAYPLPDHHNPDGWAYWSPMHATVQRIITVTDECGDPVDFYVQDRGGMWVGGMFFREFRPEFACSPAFAYAPWEEELMWLLSERLKVTP